MLPSNRGRVFYGFRITKLWKVVKNRCGKLRHSRIGSVVQINKRFSWNQYWKSNREWMRIKNNQKLNSEILLLSRETGSNTGYNRYRTLFSTPYSSVVKLVMIMRPLADHVYYGGWFQKQNWPNLLFMSYIYRNFSFNSLVMFLVKFSFWDKILCHMRHTIRILAH